MKLDGIDTVMSDLEERLHALERIIEHHPSLQPSTSRWYNIKQDDLMVAWWLLLGTMAIIVATQTIGFILVARILHRLDVRTTSTPATPSQQPATEGDVQPFPA